MYLCLLLSEKDDIAQQVGQISSLYVFISLTGTDSGQDFSLNVYGLSGSNVLRFGLSSTL